jgi:hypothetical protein
MMSFPPASTGGFRLCAGLKLCRPILELETDRFIESVLEFLSHMSFQLFSKLNLPLLAAVLKFDLDIF